MHGNAKSPHNNTGNLVLFFGCRNKSSDFYFEEEWHDLETKDLLKLFVAFSRDQKNKVYVQHKIELEKELVAKMIFEQKASVFIAGNAKFMPEAVKLALKNALVDCGFLDDSDGATFYIEKMEKENRLQLETWS